MATPYAALHKYLDQRYAETVVLRLTEIEDILGSTLPEPARLQTDWWASLTSEQSACWISAQRTAVPNLVSQTVTFVRAV